MKPAAEQLSTLLENITFSRPKVPVINNVDVQMPTEPNDIKLALVQQLYSPVRWTETVVKLADLGVENLLEVGPGKVLTGLVKRIDNSLTGRAVNTRESIESL